MTQTAEVLRFRVRAGLNVHRRRLQVREEPGRTVREWRTESYGAGFGRPLIELPGEEIRLHAHALEPTDERSAAALEALHFKAPLRPAEQRYEATLAAIVTAAVVEALRAAGVLPAAKAAR